MGTKINPGAHDCYHNAAPDEEMFILLGRDRMAGALVELWTLLREKEQGNTEKVQEARACASRMKQQASTMPYTMQDLLRGFRYEALCEEILRRGG